ncbi:MAG: hypothetical protein AAGI71_03075 [Bacteroidota bacterium]
MSLRFRTPLPSVHGDVPRPPLSLADWFRLGGLVLVLHLLCPGLEHAVWAQAADVPTYELDRPDATVSLPNTLREASGLIVLTDDLVGTIEDERGLLYLVETATGRIGSAKRFGPDGDYEGLTHVGPRVFVLRSDGTLFDIADWRADSLVVRIHASPLSRRHDTEGVAYDPDTHQLLVACKEYAGPGRARQKAIFAFDLATETWRPDPVATVSLSAFNRLAEDSQLDRMLRRFLTPFLDVSGFKPSGLALHPTTGHRYVLSSGRSSLVILAPDGTLLDVQALPQDLLPQPEGIAFTPDGDLLIATEGVLAQSHLLRFGAR